MYAHSHAFSAGSKRTLFATLFSHVSYNFTEVITNRDPHAEMLLFLRSEFTKKCQRGLSSLRVDVPQFLQRKFVSEMQILSGVKNTKQNILTCHNVLKLVELKTVVVRCWGRCHNMLKTLWLLCQHTKNGNVLPKPRGPTQCH